jgi:hypothetical protein
MKTQVAIITTALIIGTGGFLFAQASKTSLTLEERVTELEARVQTLEAKPKNPSPSPSPEVGATEPREVKGIPEAKKLDSLPPEVSTSVKWQNLELWKGKLSKGMTKDNVITLFGKPDTVVAYGPAGERWWYGSQSGGTIDFSTDGRVESWLVPHIKE